MKEILVIAINYACEKETFAYAKNFENFEGKDKIILCVVDNKSSEGSTLKQDLQSLNCDIIYFNARQNLGYMNGSLYGVRMFEEQNRYIPKWVAISNTDIEYYDNLFYSKFLSNNYTDNVWCVGPAVLDKRRGYINPYYKERLPISHINRIINVFSSKFKAKVYVKLSQIKAALKNCKTDKGQSQYVYANHGSFFVLKKDFFESLGEEKFDGFLYCEENFVAEFILENGKKEYYDSSLEVVHNANLVTGKFDISKKAKFTSESMRYIKRRFYD